MSFDECVCVEALICLLDGIRRELYLRSIFWMASQFARSICVLSDFFSIYFYLRLSNGCFWYNISKIISLSIDHIES